MHALYLGVFKRALSYFVPEKGFLLIQAEMQKNLVYNHQASGKPLASRVTNEGFANVKAVELKEFMSTMATNVSRPVARSEEEYKTMKHLISALRLLDGHGIKVSDVEVAHQHLLAFAKEFQSHYKKQAVVPNFHFMLHLRDSIYKFGPICCFWGFNFERNNMRQMQSNIFAYDINSVAHYYDS